MIAALFALVVALLNQHRLSQANPRVVFLISTVIVVCGMLCFHRVYHTAENSASFLFLLAFAIFDLGLAPFYIFNLTIPVSNVYILAWLSSSLISQAVMLVTLASISIVLGNLCGAIWGTLRSPTRQHRDAMANASVRSALAIPATILLTICVALFIADVLIIGGLGAFTGGYANFRLSGTNGFTNYLYPLIGLAGGMIGLSSPSRARRIGIAVFAFYLVLMLAVGLRSDVFFPLFGTIVLIGYRRKILNGKRVILLAVLGLTLVSFIGQFRSVATSPVAGETPAVAATGSTPPISAGRSAAFDPFGGLAELGSSLRPTVVVLQWRANGQPGLDGASFVSPFYRMMHRLIPELGAAPPAATDPDVLNEVVFRTVGAVGFSQVAEAYDNWGTAGVVGVLLVIGLILSWVDRSPSDVFSQLVRVSVFVPLVIEERNTFTPVPVHILLGLLASTLIILSARSVAGRRSKLPVYG